MNRALLEKPFQPDQVKQRQGRFGILLDYVEGHTVIARLNEAFEGNWTFEIDDHWILNDTEEVLVLGSASSQARYWSP
jgi:recombination DNA repair RAD52 pathway protein